MPRPTKLEQEKKQRLTITIDKSMYKNLKAKKVQISTYINQLLRIANSSTSDNQQVVSATLTGGLNFLFSITKLSEVIPLYHRWIQAQEFSEVHYKKLYQYSSKLGKNAHFYSYAELVKVKHLFKNGGYYKATISIGKFLMEQHPDCKELVSEIEKIKRICKKPRCNPDLYTPTDEEVKKSLQFLQEKNQNYYQFYLGLLHSGVRIRELAAVCEEPEKYRVVREEGFRKIVINSTRGYKSAFFIYLPADYELPKPVSMEGLSRFLSRHKELLRPKYIRNWFYKKCIEQGIPAAIADFYQGRTPVSIGDKHYLEKEKLADINYEKIITHLNK